MKTFSRTEPVSLTAKDFPAVPTPCAAKILLDVFGGRTMVFLSQMLCRCPDFLAP